MTMHRVALLGAGPVAQAIHLPTLARFADRVRVSEVMDVNAGLADRVAALHDARPSHSIEELLAGPGFDLAVIGTPDRFHVEHIEAVCAAGARGILAEKPLATSPAEAQRVVDALERSGTVLVLGAMHTYDPAWLQARAAASLTGPFHVRSAIYIPNNTHFEDMATTMLRPDPVAGGAASLAQQVRGGVLGLAIHNLPLVRTFLPKIDRVHSVRVLQPWGYAITASGPAGSLELLARVGGSWQPDWTLAVWGADGQVSMDFPPSYVHAGSASAVLTDAAGTRTFGPHRANGYEAEWRELLSVLDGEPARHPLGQVVEDLRYALALADLTVAALGEEAVA